MKRFACLVCNQEVYGPSSSSHLRKKHDLHPRDYYHKYIIKSEEVPKCKYCSKEVKFNRLSRPYGEYCSHSCRSKATTQGERNPFYGKTHTKEIRKIISEGMSGEKHVFYGKKRPEHSKFMTEFNKQPEVILRNSKRFTEMNIRHHSDPNWRRRNGRGGFSHTGVYFSKKAGKVRYRSSWEKKAFEYLDEDDSVKTFIVEPFGIDYSYNGRKGTYYPDLLVEYKNGELVLTEIKPKEFLKDPAIKAKFKAACNYCKLHRIRFKVWHQDNWLR